MPKTMAAACTQGLAPTKWLSAEQVFSFRYDSKDVDEVVATLFGDGDGTTH
jgi:hypothetical protein